MYILISGFIPYKDFHEKTSSGTGLEYSYEMYIKYALKVNIKKIKNSFIMNL